MQSVVGQIGLGAILGAVGAAAAGVAGYGIFVPSCSLLCPLTVRGRTGGAPAVALTFDDGPHPEATARILDILGELSVPGAFFVVGLHVERWPDTVARMHAEGHLVCNHTHTHSCFSPFRRWRGWASQLRRADDAVERTIGRRPALFRPPFGIKTPHLARAIRRTGHRVVTWSLRAMDGVPTTPDRIVRRLVPRARAGDIVALHDGLVAPAHRNLQATVDAIRPLVQGLRDRGIGMVRLDDLTGLPAYAAGPPPEAVPP